MEEGRPGSPAEEGSERQYPLPSGAAAAKQDEGRCPASQESRTEAEQHPFRSQPESQRSGELHVAPPQAAAADPANQGKQAAASQGTGQGMGPERTLPGGTEQPGQGQHDQSFVQDQQMIQILGDSKDQTRRKHKDRQQFRARRDLASRGGKGQSGGKGRSTAPTQRRGSRQADCLPVEEPASGEPSQKIQHQNDFHAHSFPLARPCHERKNRRALVRPACLP